MTTREELDLALATADRVIVEGDDRLLSYAATKASQDPALSSVHIEISSPDVRTQFATQQPIPTFDAELPEARVNPPPHPTSMPPSSASHSPFPAFVPAFLIVTALGAVGVTLFAVLESRGPRLSSTSGPVSPPPIAAPPVHVTGEPLPAGNLSLVLGSLAWPAVAIVAIVALFLISRQAIAGGRNVEISWKVTEKVAGRLVITKVRSRIPRSEAI